MTRVITYINSKGERITCNDKGGNSREMFYIVRKYHRVGMEVPHFIPQLAITVLDDLIMADWKDEEEKLK